jgi:lysophospholipase L1-like esterase
MSKNITKSLDSLATRAVSSSSGWLAAAAFGLLVTCIVWLGAEFAFRMFSDIRPQGNSRSLFIDHSFGDSSGNAKNVTAVSFGITVHTDSMGFRESEEAVEPSGGRTALLVLGDSIAFGVGVQEPATFVGLLRKQFPNTIIYNSAVIGYGLADYRNVVNAFVPQHPEIKYAYLAFCLNDVTDESATEISESLRQPWLREKPTLRSLLFGVNNFLRSRSRLYLMLRAWLTDPQQRYFDADNLNYRMPEDKFQKAMQPLADISQTLSRRGISLTVVVFPYEAQLRSNDPALALPQRRLSNYMRERGIRFIDLMPDLRALPATKLFLVYDPMHLSGTGHRVVANVLCRDLLTVENAKDQSLPVGSNAQRSQASDTKEMKLTQETKITAKRSE